MYCIISKKSNLKNNWTSLWFVCTPFQIQFTFHADMILYFGKKMEKEDEKKMESVWFWTRLDLMGAERDNGSKSLEWFSKHGVCKTDKWDCFLHLRQSCQNHFLLLKVNTGLAILPSSKWDKSVIICRFLLDQCAFQFRFDLGVD